MNHPHVFCRLETIEGIFDADTYMVHLERQRPTLGIFELYEPVQPDTPVILNLGFLGQVNRICSLWVQSCSEMAPKTFKVIALEPVRQLLDLKYTDQLTAADLISALRRIADFIKLPLEIIGPPPATRPQNLVFLGNIRNALDQLWQVFQLKNARWCINLNKKKLQILAQGKFEIDPVEIPLDYLKTEFDGGIEMNIIPNLRPYTPVIWRGSEETVDIARINGKTGSMFITFAGNQ